MRDADLMYISDEPFDDWLDEEENEKADYPNPYTRMRTGSYKYRRWRKALLDREVGAY
jgi:hypothetical protein